jgi:hypothetical protein
MRRYSKEETEYTDDHGTSPEQCSKCTYYANPTTCEIVVGRIRPEGWCNKFEAKT